MSDDYERFRGKCKEMSEAACAADPTLRLVRGHYVCPVWGEQAHWWAVKPDGTIVDPTVAQFPSKGMGDYVEFDGTLKCDECGKKMREADVKYAEGNYACCSYQCFGRLVGVFCELKRFLQMADCNCPIPTHLHDVGCPRYEPFQCCGHHGGRPCTSWEASCQNPENYRPEPRPLPEGFEKRAALFNAARALAASHEEQGRGDPAESAGSGPAENSSER